MLNTAMARRQPRNEQLAPEDEEDEEERPRGTWWKVLLVAALIAVLGYFGVNKLYQGIMGSFTTTEVPEYTVPKVVGYTVEEAEALEQVAGIFEIVVDTTLEYSSEYAEGVIIRQSPEAERTRRSASGDLIPINVTVSRGARSGGMPDLIGEEGRSARLILEQDKDLSALHLKIMEGESEYSDTVEAGHVVRTEPAKGTQLGEGDTVTLFLSMGPETKYSIMVLCEGETMENVQKKMDELNLTAEFVKVEGSAPLGTVLTQSVETGAEVEQGTTVVFTYSDGEKEIPKTITFNVPFSPETVHVEIYLDDTQVLSTDLPGDHGALEETFYAKAGDYRLRIYADGQQWVDEVVTFSE